MKHIEQDFLSDNYHYHKIDRWDSWSHCSPIGIVNERHVVITQHYEESREGLEEGVKVVDRRHAIFIVNYIQGEIIFGLEGEKLQTK